MNRFPQLDPESVRAVSTEIVHEFATAKIKTDVGPLAEHNARDVLRHATDSDLQSP